MPASSREKDRTHARRARELERILVTIVASPTDLEGDMIRPLTDADVDQVMSQSAWRE
jgi:hypothetical protein